SCSTRRSSNAQLAAQLILFTPTPYCLFQTPYFRTKANDFVVSASASPILENGENSKASR
ncbi:MAG: hypothetical protein KKC55_14020, partial [Gammaproteobacteria bacterium]|nr:hypothetical protein [Gammaproteobacteria bacterium]